MSKPESDPPVSSENPELIGPEREPAAEKPRPSRLRRFFLRHLPLTVAAALLLLAFTTVCLYLWASSASFENIVRVQIASKLETATGGRVEIASFHWHLLHLEAEAGGLVIHGLESPREAPYAQAEHVRVRFSILSFLSPRILLRDLEISRPQLHLIVYRDGSTNQPQPRKQKKTTKPALDRFFDLKAGHIAVEQGVLDYENRAATFDFQDRHIPLDFAANDLSLRMAYLPASSVSSESYHIEAGVRDLSLVRGTRSRTGKLPTTVTGYLQGTLDLTRNNAVLRSLRITASSHGVKDRSLDISGTLTDFAHPRWQAWAVGELDLRLVDPVTGYPFAPEGIAHLNLYGSGQAGTFRTDGGIHVENGSYIGTGVVATGFGLDARVHADPEQLQITSIQVRLREGGKIEGSVSLNHWLPALPGAATLRLAETTFGKARNAHLLPTPPARTSLPDDVITLPVNGKVTAHFDDVALDTVLEMVCDPPFQHLGFDSRVSGPANALWINGDKNTLSVDALLNLTPPAQAGQGKVLAGGLVDATYTQRDGAVDLRRLKIDLPNSQVLAHGHLGAYPMDSPSALTVDFHSGNMNEFDTLLRDLGLARAGRFGTAALPVVLNGQADFHGTWTGSLVDPRLSGSATATQLAIEFPLFTSSYLTKKTSTPPQFIHVDSVEAKGSYSAARIDIEHGILRLKNAEIALSGSLTAGLSSVVGSGPHPPPPAPSFNANSVLHLRMHADRLGLDDLRPVVGENLPVTGSINAQLLIDGPIHALDGSGWAELNKGSIFSVPVEKVRAQGNLTKQSLNLTSVTISEEAGSISASGKYNLESHIFQVDAKGTGIDVARIGALRNHGLEVTGKLGFTVSGSGTFDDPHLEAHATLPNLTVDGEPLGGLELRAHTTSRVVTYDLTSRLEAAALTAHGQTSLSGDYATKAQFDFSRLNIGVILRLAHLQSLSGESSLAGTVNIDGPLGRLTDMRGDARLQELEVTVSGVHLKSEGGAHLTLDHSILHLDPLHVTGEQTNLYAQGSLSLKDKRQLDFAASGSINLKVAEIIDPDLTASGNTSFQVEAHGPLMNPGFKGQIQIQDAALSLEDLPNGLSQLQGALEFNQNRLEIKSLTAMSGGGLLSVSGYLAYQHGLYADLKATGNEIRIRYPQGVSSLANASLHLQGPQNNLLLSGDVLITRFTLSPDLDIAALAAQANAVDTIAPLEAPSNHIRLDVHFTSSPQLRFQNSYAKLAGNVDLRLRGTVASPSLLGRISITEGNGVIAGTRYDLQHGDIYFTNPVRIQPFIDLNATAHVQDYDINLGLHGTPDKLAVTYRSDPPLPEADVVALLALGRTENQQRLYTQQQEAAGANPTTDALLGGALNATVSSRVQKLFGAGSVKVDPNYLGALGNSTSRIIVEEQLGSTVTLTYATNVNTTAQQLIQAEIAINRHVSLQVARDESGVFSMVLKATRRYR
jgi:translocation and assembly module TamB